MNGTVGGESLASFGVNWIVYALQWWEEPLTEWLVRTFVPDYDDTQSPAVRTSYGTLASVVSIVCNVALCIAKGAVGVAFGSVSVVADALNNLSDAFSNIVALLGFKMASRPADEHHPYGHGRSEYLAGLMVAMMIMVIGVELSRSSVERILSPQPATLSAATVVSLLASIAVKLYMARLNQSLGKRIASKTLEATAADSRNDVIATSAVLLAAVASSVTGVDLDGWAGLAVGLFIIYSGYGLMRETVDPLLGTAPDPEMVEDIRRRILAYPGVLGTHDLMVHDYGPGRKFASAHVEMSADIDPLTSHETIDAIERDFLTTDGLSLVLHYDPIAAGDSADGALRQWIQERIRVIHPDLTIHDLRVVRRADAVRVAFDCVKPRDLDMTPGELRAAVDVLIRSEYPTYSCDITIDESFASAN